jgi:hypothetical protein
MGVPIVFRTGAKASRDRVIWAMTYKQAAIRAALPNPPAMGLDPRTGELVIVVPTATAATGKEVLRAKLHELYARLSSDTAIGVRAATTDKGRLARRARRGASTKRLK